VRGIIVLLMVLIPSLAEPADTDSTAEPTWIPKLLGLQATGIYQNMPAFHNPYEGEKSLSFQNGLGRQLTQSYGVYLGSQLTDNLQAYLDIEMFRGSGLSNGVGLGGYPNGDVIRSGSASIGNGPYFARLFLRYIIALSTEKAEIPERAMDQMPVALPRSRIEIEAGKMSPADDMDLNGYANNQRTQFLNYAFMFNPAWDYASDTRGYSVGFSVSLINPSWRLSLGSYMLNTTANGMTLDKNVLSAQGNNLELTLQPGKWGAVIRLLAFYNRGRMGDYQEAMDRAAAAGTTPDVHANERLGREKYGFGLNAEQPLADDGNTGIFARAGWSDGRTSAWSYTEVDRHASVGLQVSGKRWGRGEDRFGMAYAVHGLAALHRQYLAAGGQGMLIGDGKLNYGWERIFEIYYRIQMGRYIQVTPDFQHIQNPGYNRDRGPAVVYSLRLRLSF
jgi:high affinity Mn2+ porin